MENFACVHHIVLISEVDFFAARTARYNAVYKRVAEYVFLVNPVYKIIAVIPFFSIIKYVFFKRCAVFVNKLARKKNKSVK